jgi:hypothetical protein
MKGLSFNIPRTAEGFTRLIKECLLNNMESEGIMYRNMACEERMTSVKIPLSFSSLLYRLFANLYALFIVILLQRVLYFASPSIVVKKNHADVPLFVFIYGSLSAAKMRNYLQGPLVSDSMEQSPSREADSQPASHEIPRLLWNSKVRPL